MKTLMGLWPVGLLVMAYAAPVSALADEIYRLTIQLQGDPRCGAQTLPRPLFVSGSEVKVASRFGPCTGPLQADGSFNLVCNHVGSAPSVHWSGKISGSSVNGTLASELFVARGGSVGVVDFKCSGTFHGDEQPSSPK